MDYDDVPFEEGYSRPRFFIFGNSTQTIDAYADFYRHEGNQNIEIVAAEGIDLVPATLYRSSSFYLPTNTFNEISPQSPVQFTGNEMILEKNARLKHNLRIQYKLTKGDDKNYINQREIRTRLVDAGGTAYSNTVFANNQPETNIHDDIFVLGSVDHAEGDIVRIQFQIIQDNTTHPDTSPTKLTIFRICWNVSFSSQN